MVDGDASGGIKKESEFSYSYLMECQCLHEILSQELIKNEIPRKYFFFPIQRKRPSINSTLADIPVQNKSLFLT